MVVAGEAVGVPETAMIELPSVKIVGAFASGTLAFGRAHPSVGRGDDVGDNLVLQGEDIFHWTVVALGPDEAMGRRIEELCCDAEMAAGAPQAAGQHVADAE